jgi:hypothetical protein
MPRAVPNSLHVAGSWVQHRVQSEGENGSRFPVSDADRAVERAGTRVPEFTNILRGIAKLAVASKNGFDSGDYERTIVVVRLDPPEKVLSRRYGIPAI